jgi:hypothetical protein
MPVPVRNVAKQVLIFTITVKRNKQKQIICYTWYVAAQCLAFFSVELTLLYLTIHSWCHGSICPTASSVPPSVVRRSPVQLEQDG